MTDRFVPELRFVTGPRVACDGTGPGLDPALGHPRVYMQIDEKGFVDCGYCDRRFVLEGGVADQAGPAIEQAGPSAAEQDSPGDDDGSRTHSGTRAAEDDAQADA